MTPKERNLIKGAIRRVFSRSELRRQILRQAIIEHHDPKRKRVKTWVQCAGCKQPEAISNVEVDHIDPVIPLHLQLEDITWDNLIDRIWCAIDNLQVLCTKCHDEKSARERKERNKFRKERKLKNER